MTTSGCPAFLVKEMAEVFYVVNFAYNYRGPLFFPVM